ncbi:MAG TPA: hypothetical protein VF230_13380 [Acidimicrobiales bacterium]
MTTPLEARGYEGERAVVASLVAIPCLLIAMFGGPVGVAVCVAASLACRLIGHRYGNAALRSLAVAIVVATALGMALSMTVFQVDHYESRLESQTSDYPPDAP